MVTMQRLILLSSLIIIRKHSHAAVSPSMEPSDFPSFVPSSVPSSSASASPSLAASMVPTQIQSQRPSNAPTRSPSSSPTFPPSDSPSDEPTGTPSYQPTKAPTNTPSAIPSTVPTQECHDHASYRSNFNNFTCSEYENIDCIPNQMVCSADQLEVLLTSCPIACDIPCGSLLRFTEEVWFRMENVSNFMDPGSVQTLEHTAVKALNDYVQRVIPEHRFLLYHAEMVKQGIISGRRNLRSDSRALAVDKLILKVSMSFGGFVKDMNSSAVSRYLGQGVIDSDLERMLRISGDPKFSDVYISQQEGDQNTSSATSDNTSSGNPGGITAGVLCAAVISGAGIAYFIRSKRRIIVGKPGNMRNETTKLHQWSSVEALVFLSSNASVESNSFQENPTGNTEAKSLPDTPSTYPWMNTVDKAESIESGNIDDQDQYEEEHPLALLFPSMIIYDHIDESNSGESNHKTKYKQVFPSKRVEASRELVAALNDPSKPIDPDILGSMYSTNLIDQSKISSDSLVMFHTHSSDGEEDSRMSTPIHRVLSDSQLNGLHTKSLNLDGEILSLALSFPNHYSNEVYISAIEDGTSSSSPDRERTYSDASTVLRSTRTQPFETPGAKSSSESCDTSKSNWFAHTFRGHFSLATPKQCLHRLASPAVSDFHCQNLFAPNVTIGGLPPRPRSRNASSNSSFFSLERDQSKDGTLLCFEAPRKGKLGLVIECTPTGGNRVARVKDYSPLLGKIIEGDQIVSIDGVDTGSMNEEEVQKLLAGNNFRRAAQMKILVLRIIDETNSGGDDSSFTGCSLKNTSLGTEGSI